MKKSKKIFFLYLIIILAVPLYYLSTYFVKNKRTEVDVNQYRKELINNNKEHDITKKYAISTGDEHSTALAASILENGGNAVDAAIAAGFSMGITMPYNGILGGGGVMLIYDKEKNESYYYDYYNSTGYEKSEHNIGIPGFLKGMEAVYNDYGSLPIEDILNPVIKQAEEGVPLSEDAAKIFERNKNLILNANSDFSENGIQKFETGTILPLPKLASSLTQILEEGFEVLYDGDSEMSQNLMRSSNLSKESLQDYKVQKSQAVKTKWQGYDVFVTGAPFSGTLAIQMLKGYDLYNLDFQNDNAEKIYSDFYEIRNLAYADHYANSYDSDKSRDNDMERITDLYVEEIYNNKSKQINQLDEDIESENTISFSVMDERYIVSGTQTLSNYWGSNISEDGFFYNNSLKNLSVDGNNKFEPLKRPRTNLSPLIFINEEEIISISSAGGNYIPQVISQIMSQYGNSNTSFEKIIDTQRIGFVRDTFIIEKEELRTHKLVDTYPNNKGYLLVDLINEIGVVSITNYKDDKYHAYFEPIRCDGDCAYSSN